MSLFRMLKRAVFGLEFPPQKLYGKALVALPKVPLYELDPLPWWSKRSWTYFFLTANATITYVSPYCPRNWGVRKVVSAFGAAARQLWRHLRHSDQPWLDSGGWNCSSGGEF